MNEENEEEDKGRIEKERKVGNAELKKKEEKEK